MENRAETRMAAAARYYARAWKGPTPEMTPAFAEKVIDRWRNNVQQGIVAVPAEGERNHERVLPRSRSFDFGGMSIEVDRDQAVFGREMYSGPRTR